MNAIDLDVCGCTYGNYRITTLVSGQDAINCSTNGIVLIRRFEEYHSGSGGHFNEWRESLIFKHIPHPFPFHFESLRTADMRRIFRNGIFGRISYFARIYTWRSTQDRRWQTAYAFYNEQKNKQSWSDPKLEFKENSEQTESKVNWNIYIEICR